MEVGGWRIETGRLGDRETKGKRDKETGRQGDIRL